VRGVNKNPFVLSLSKDEHAFRQSNLGLVGSRPDSRGSLFFLPKRNNPKKKAPSYRGASRSLALLTDPGGSLNSPWLRQGSNRRSPKSPGSAALLSAAEGSLKTMLYALRAIYF
jgi:hypothetical protein